LLEVLIIEVSKKNFFFFFPNKKGKGQQKKNKNRNKGEGEQVAFKQIINPLSLFIIRFEHLLFLLKEIKHEERIRKPVPKVN